MGGILINYPDNSGTPIADILTLKLMFNSVISTPNSKFMTIDIKDFYLMMPMDRYEYFRMKLDLFPQDIIHEYRLRNKVDTYGNVFCKVRCGMYGLPQASIIPQELLTKCLHKAGYYRQSTITPGYWCHDWHPISFTLIIDNFGMKYINKNNVKHLMIILKKDYKIDTNWDSTQYLGLTLAWDYKKHKVHLSMPGYIENALIRFGHELPNKPQMQPHPHTIPTYSTTVQYAKATDASPAATNVEGKYICQVIGVLLYYGWGLSLLAAAQSKPTAHRLFLVKWLLDYVATNPDTILTYKRSNRVLAIHRDASYLSKSLARSWVGGHFFCSSNIDDPPSNGAVLNLSKILKAIMSSTAEAKLGALYINAREAIPLQHVLKKMGHKQPPTPIQTDNSTAHGMVTNNIQPQCTKAMAPLPWLPRQ
jgi:hypothetical protein